MTNTPLKLGFIGLGIMGAPMAGQLRAVRHALSRGRRSPTARDDSSAARSAAFVVARPCINEASRSASGTATPGDTSALPVNMG